MAQDYELRNNWCRLHHPQAVEFEKSLFGRPIATIADYRRIDELEELNTSAIIDNRVD
jgi:hypothetical protein